MFYALLFHADTAYPS